MPTTTQTAPAPQPTIHHPRPAIVATAKGCTDQRRFGSDLPLRTGDDGVNVEVVRFSDENTANILLRGRTYWTACATVTAAQLLELAARLIDAAHDIEAHPARTLLQQHWGASTPAGQEVSA